MKTLLNLAEKKEELAFLTRTRPVALLPILGKPFLHHLIEILAKMGLHSHAIILHHFPHKIEDYLQQGERWGVSIAFFLVNRERTPFNIVSPSFSLSSPEPILLGLGTSMPLGITLPEQDLVLPKLYFYPNGNWSGWGWVPSKKIAQFPPDMTWDAIPTFLQDFSIEKSEPLIDVTTISSYTTTLFRLLDLGMDSLIPPASSKEVEKRMWISRGVEIHPSALLHLPLFIGKESKIEKGAVIGPYAIIESRCLIGENSSVEKSVILSDSVIGQGLTLDEAIIDRTLFIDQKRGTSLVIKEDFILTTLKGSHRRSSLLSWFGRGLALILWGIFSPLYLFLRLREEMIQEKVVLIPTSENELSILLWRKFAGKTALGRLFRGLPILLHIIKGEAHWVGLPPKSRELVYSMSDERRHLYLRSKLGAIFIYRKKEEEQDEDLEWADEMVYCVHENGIYDIKIFFQWLKNKLREILSFF